MALEVINLSESETEKLLTLQESHFSDMKSKEVAPAALTKLLSAFANSDGGELYIGISEVGDREFRWDGFQTMEGANGHLQALDGFFPLGQDFEYAFLASEKHAGFVLRISVQKTRDVRRASNGKAYVRRGAQSVPYDTHEKLLILERAKGISSYEDEALANVSTIEITNSVVINGFMLEVVPHTEPEPWAAKQRLIVDGRPTVAGVLLFSDEPQVDLPKASVKIYRYKSASTEGTRETLAFDPITVEGHIYDQIAVAVSKTVAIVEEIRIATDGGLRPIKYPHESLHEIITNAILHRDYSLNDDVHVRVFDNRIEVESPGRLPAHITAENILRERFARNPKLVRLVNKFKDPPNKDVGEGLNTAFRSMKQLRLRDPQIIEKENSVLVVIRHEQLASPQQQIVEYARRYGTVNNSQARAATGIESEGKVRALFKELIQTDELEQVPGTFKATTAYRIPQKPS